MLGIGAMAGMPPVSAQEPGGAESPPAIERFQEVIEPVLIDRCYSCHAGGMKKGNVSLDEFESDDALLAAKDLWWSVLKNVRAGIMPPEGETRLSAGEIAALGEWIKRDVFHANPADPDPGRVTLRRLNRQEYRNTIRDLMGIDFRTEEEFPPDDTGYGFDTISDVLTVSPLLLEKYLQAAETIVARAVPTVARVVAEREIRGRSFRAKEGDTNGEKLSFYEEAEVSRLITLEKQGEYRLSLDLDVRSGFDFDPGTCEVVVRFDDRELLRQNLSWASFHRHKFEWKDTWEAGEHRLSLTLKPLTPTDKKKSFVDLAIHETRLEGPLEPSQWVRPGNYDRFFADGGEPKDEEDRRRAATAVLSRFATRAFRRPVDLTTVTRYVDFAETEYQQPGKTFEQGVARAMVAILASPRFLFRIEATEPSPADASGQGYPRLDEYSLASRLSYFFWSTMPDEALHRLAESNQLRANLEREVKRLLTDSKSRELVENFTGQWLQLRDIEGVSINEGSILFRERTPRNLFVGPPAPVGQGRGNRRGRIEFDRDLRLAMRRESEMLFAHIMREDRPALELVDADYTFLNERLATHYGILDVKGEEMRRVELPEGSPRGGVLTQGAVLAVTSNPTRTSPVKRGLFILDNLLGTPAPPPPEVVPQLEESEKAIEGHEPTLREVLELHRSKPLCAACHARMDPLGLALEEFNAMGMHRTMERGLPIEGGGQLITGERFQNIRELKKVLTDSRRGDFYRCLTEKLMTYALGRGLEASDVETVDQIVDRLEKNDGRFSGLLMGIVESAPFQKLRPPGGETRAASLSSKDTSRLLSEAKP